jgi:hypothetical protein
VIGINYIVSYINIKVTIKAKLILNCIVIIVVMVIVITIIVGCNMVIINSFINYSPITTDFDFSFSFIVSFSLVVVVGFVNSNLIIVANSFNCHRRLKSYSRDHFHHHHRIGMITNRCSD